MLVNPSKRSKFTGNELHAKAILPELRSVQKGNSYQEINSYEKQENISTNH